MYALTFPAGADAAGVAALKANSNVLSVDADLPRDTAGAPTTRSTATSGRCRRSAGIRSTARSTRRGRATVAILDTGVDASHPDLAGVVVPGKNIITGSGDGTCDPNGHGTAMAGIVAAETNNGDGIAGVGYAGVKVMPVTVLGANGIGADSDVINGVVYAAQHGANVILMSFSNPGYSASLQKAVDYAWSKASCSSPRPATTARRRSTTRRVTAASSASPAPAAAILPSARATRAPDVFLAAPGEGILSTQRAAATARSAAPPPRRQPSPVRRR